MNTQKEKEWARQGACKPALIMACGYNDKKEPGFTAVLSGTGESFEHFGVLPQELEPQQALLYKFGAWKKGLGPKVGRAE